MIANYSSLIAYNKEIMSTEGRAIDALSTGTSARRSESSVGPWWIGDDHLPGRQVPYYIHFNK
ncbi:MAG TPA: hypothetical protein VKJ45_02195 [Blastocatellia bacterium]|nr:hypothetical protein [Blastocatellia bacterium]